MQDSEVIEVLSDNIAPEEVIDPAVVIIGGGPVGLATAIAFRMQEMNYVREQGLHNHVYKKILIIEKYKTYQRSHVLNLNLDSFKNFPANEKFSKIIKDMPSVIRTNDIEDIFLKFAHELDIKIEYKHVTYVEEEVIKKYPSATFIVGADGSHSVVHSQLFDGEFQFRHDMQYIVEMKYETEDETRALNYMTEVIPIHSYTKHFVTEVVGKTKDNRTPVTVRFFVDESTYKSMQEYTFKNFTTLANEKLDKDLRQSLQAWIAGRKDFAEEKRVENSERISATKLPVYASKKFTKELEVIKSKNEKRKVKVVLVGDGAFGMPYFRGLNNGLICAKEAGDTIFNELYPRPKPYLGNFWSQSPLDSYGKKVQQLLNKEKLSAEYKNFLVNALQTHATLVRKSPQLSFTKLQMTEGGRHFTEEMEQQRSPSEANGWTTANYSYASSRLYKTTLGSVQEKILNGGSISKASSSSGTDEKKEEVSSNKKMCKQM